jgi:S1-C subfamily serine protease
VRALTWSDDEGEPVEEEALDTYSRVVTRVARLLSPSVANPRARRRLRGRGSEGGGSAVAFTPDGYLTSAHVVAGAKEGTASFVDGHERRVEVVGSDPLSDLAVLRSKGGLVPAAFGHRRGAATPPAPLAAAVARTSAVEVVEVEGSPSARQALVPRT